MRSSRDRGSATVHAAVLLALVTTVAVVVVQAAVLVRLRHEVAAAADLAALAASRASASGADGCAAARLVADRNGAVLVSCRMDLDVATVTARGVSSPWWGKRWAVEQRARAAPADYVPAD